MEKAIITPQTAEGKALIKQQDLMIKLTSGQPLNSADMQALLALGTLVQPKKVIPAVPVVMVKK